MGEIYIGPPYYNRNPNIGPRIDSTLGQSPIAVGTAVLVRLIPIRTGMVVVVVIENPDDNISEKQLR